MGTKKDIKKLKKELKELGKSDAEQDEFINTNSEEARKKITLENYEKFKQDYQWKPDAPIEPDDPNEPEPEPEPQPTPEPTPEPTPGTVVFDSQRDTRLHDSKVRTITQEGDLETRASGDPKIVVNNDGTFSLVCKAGHGRIYPYVKNYNSVLEIECAFWKEAPGQDLSLKLRSRHNEDGNGENRFGGYGLSVDSGGWGAKREIYHNEHDQSESGKLPGKFENQKYFKIWFRVMDDDNKVKQTGKIDYLDGKGYQNFMNKVDSSPKAYMVDKPLYDAKSYFWIRSNIDSGTGEIRFKRVTLTAL